MTGGGNGGFNVYKYQYPKSRTTMAKDNVPMGVAGSVELLNSKVSYTHHIHYIVCILHFASHHTSYIAHLRQLTTHLYIYITTLHHRSSARSLS